MYEKVDMGVQSEHGAVASHSFNKANLWSAIHFGTVSMLVFLLMPAYVGGLASLRFNDQQLGMLASMDFAGITTTCTLAVLWVKRVDWRVAGILGMAILAAANLLCVGITDYDRLMGLRFIAGLAGGVGISLSFAIVAGSPAPDRYMGLFVTVQVLFQSLGFVMAPSLFAAMGVDGFYYLFAISALLMMPLLRTILRNGYASSVAFQTATRHPASGYALLLVLFAMSVFFVGQGAFWAFGERIGMAAGLDGQSVARALAFTAIASLFGAVLSAWLDVRYGRFWPILAAVLLQLVTLALLVAELSPWLFTALFSIFAFAWNFGIAFQVGVMAALDRRGSYTALVPAFQCAGLAIGPSLAGAFVSDGQYHWVNGVSGLALIAYLILILPFAVRRQVRVP